MTTYKPQVSTVLCIAVQLTHSAELLMLGVKHENGSESLPPDSSPMPASLGLFRVQMAYTQPDGNSAGSGHKSKLLLAHPGTSGSDLSSQILSHFT